MHSLIVCTELNNGIGVNNTIPWHSAADFKHFKQCTIGKKVVMGYNTWKSLPEKARPLAERTNVIVTSRPQSAEDKVYSEQRNVIFIHESTLQSFLETNTSCVIIGGAKIYQLALPHVFQIIQSVIPESHECDTFFTFPDAQFEHYDTETLSDGVKVRYYERILSGKVLW